MFRFLIVLVLAGLLAACTTDQGAGETDQPTVEPSVAASGSSAGSSVSGEASPACEEAFAPLAEMELSTTSDLGDVPEVDATIESCESVDDWLAGAATVIDDVSPGAADLLLRIRCEGSTMSSTPICEELSSS